MIELLIAFGAGLISFLSPCVLPLIPGYVSFISGQSLQDILKLEKINIFTFEEIDGICYFKVKILNSDSSWMREKNNVIIQKQVSNSNKMYVKAIIKSNDKGISPHINSFSIRVI